MRAISGLQGGANSEVYQATLDYGCVVVAFASKSARKQLELLQNKAIRTILGVPRWSSTSACQLEVDIMPQQCCHEARQAIFTDKVLRNPNHTLHDQITKGFQKSREVFTDNTWLYKITDAWQLHSQEIQLPVPEHRHNFIPWSKSTADICVHRPYSNKLTAPPNHVKEAAYKSIAKAEFSIPSLLY